MNEDKSFSNLSMSEKRKRLMAMVDTRKNSKRKKLEMPYMLEKGEKTNSKKPINGGTKMTKSNSSTLKKKLQNSRRKVKKTKKVSQVGDHNHVAASASDASNERKFNSSEIEEYWVPVHLSHTQMEQYCSLLNSNFESLSSSLRDNSSLNGILTQTQKCCDHPYLVDPTLRESLKKNLLVDQLDAEISVSGKLQLLDKLLLKIKECGLRVIVLFQVA
ncbi:helicase protein MOM1-like [Lactuca sativa]|uniref:helicase protein MOM1-like n=1 Tax=Lactuca sativa TaxID=4236 RepID=UPI001C68C628|nr:helicase protein MOM1-like [Lactuca sativa]